MFTVFPAASGKLPDQRTRFAVEVKPAAAEASVPVVCAFRGIAGPAASTHNKTPRAKKNADFREA
jgi:hypothetical protein